jgi:hypothetical protein
VDRIAAFNLTQQKVSGQVSGLPAAAGKLLQDAAHVNKVSRFSSSQLKRHWGEI